MSTLIQRQRDLAAAKDVRERTPWDAGSIVRGGAMFAAGIVDPLNLATAFVPWTKSITALRGIQAATLAESALTRAGARAVLGAADAGISTAVLEPAFYYGRQQLGDDYGALDSMANIAFGTAFGGGLHAGGGALADKLLPKFGKAPAHEQYAGLSVDEIHTVQNLQREIQAGNMNQADVNRALETYSPRMREVAGFPAGEAGPEVRVAREAELAGVPEARGESVTPLPEVAAAARPRATAARIVASADGGTITAESRAGTVGGTVDAANGTLTIDQAAVPEHLRAAGHDVALYERLVNDAIDRGLSVRDLADGNEITARIHQELEARGFTVTPIEATPLEGNAAAVATPAANDTPMVLIDRGPGYSVPVESAQDVANQIAPPTREAAMRASVAQSVDGRNVDVDAVVNLDPSRGGNLRDALAAADRNLAPEQTAVADFDAASAVQARVDAAPKWHSLADAEAQAAEVDTLLADTVKAGDDAYLYSRARVKPDPEAVAPALAGEGNPDLSLFARGIPAEDSPEVLEAALRRAYGSDTAALMDAGHVKVVATPDDIPQGPHPGDVKAATSPEGTVYVVASNMSENEARGILLHEVGVHVGMKKMLGPELFDTVLRELDDAVLRGESWAQDARSRVPDTTPLELVREEQLAYLVEHSPELPLVQRIIAAIREWAYRNFAFAREHLTLTEADFRAMATSALRAVSRAERTEGGAFPGVSYSRGEIPEPVKAADELKPYDDKIARAKQYPAVLRAAADKLESDAMATEAMKAALPDLSTEEVNTLLQQLRKQVQGLRSVTRAVRDAIGAEEVVNDLQSEAMRAADSLANNIQMAAVIEKRNAALNMNARLKATAFLNQFRTAKIDFEGFRGLLVGTERKRVGGRLSVDAEQKGYRGAWMGGLIADLSKAEVLPLFTSGQFDREVYIALYKLGKGEDLKGLPPEAAKMADIVNKYQTDARNTRNRFGAWIRDLNGYITRQSHDQFKIRSAGEAEFKKTVLPLLDLERTLRDFQGSADAFLTRVYDDFAAGSHMKTPTGEDDLPVGRGSSLAKRESVSRVLYFKDGAAAFEYNSKFGQGNLAESVLHGLDSAAKSAGLLKLLGTNPEATLTRLFDEYAESLRGDPVRREKFNQHRGELNNLLAHVDGSANIPGNATGAKIASAARSWVSMSRLGGMLISSITDLSNYAAELRFGQNKNLLGGTLEGIGALVQGRAAGEKKRILSSLGVFHESTLGSVFARFDSPDLIGGKMAAAMQQVFKLSGINWWTESLRDGYALTHSHYLATNADRDFAALPEALRDMLGLYRIDAGKWEVLRSAVMPEADGKPYMTPEGLRTVPDSALESYISSVGRTASPAAVQNLRDDLAQALRTMTIDRMHHAVIEPGARTRAFMLRGTQPGTATGELLRFVTQFKSFPVALIQMTLGREIYGRGYDTLGDYLKRGKGDMLGLASFIALSTAMGYAAMSIKDLIRGKNPRPVDDPRTWLAAAQQGGGLGIYGDFLFGKFNRMGGSLTGTLAGPVAGIADTAADLWTRIRSGDDVAAASFNAALQNTPFMNLFYTRTALDYLILFRIQEALNPGFLRRSEKRIERENGQTFWLPPSQNAL